jgi:hypothetical protein
VRAWHKARLLYPVPMSPICIHASHWPYIYASQRQRICCCVHGSCLAPGPVVVKPVGHGKQAAPSGLLVPVGHRVHCAMFVELSMAG